MRLQGCYVDAVTLHDEMLAGWVVVLGAQQFSNMTYAVDLGVDGFRNRKPLGLYCIWCFQFYLSSLLVIPSSV
jgi:hypothetical protein